MTRSSEWYSAGQDGTPSGPVSAAALVERHSAGEITDETLVWSPGMDDWQPFSLAVERKRVPPPLPSDRGRSPSAVGTAKAERPPLGVGDELARNEQRAFLFLGGVHHPWRRLFARWIDGAATGVVLGIGVGAASVYDESLSGLLRSPLLLTLVVFAVWAIVEALLLSTTGTTPGKWLFGIRVSDAASGTHLSFTAAIKREILVLVQGCGAGIPVICLITQLCAYQRLTKTGTTRWDASTRAMVTHKKWTPIRAIASVLAVTAVLALLVALQLVASAEAA